MGKLELLEEKFKKKDLPEFAIGDTVDVHFKIQEENKMRVQLFTGIVIGRKGSGIRENFTVRRISYGEGVERVFPINSPLIDKIVVKKKGKVHRAKLYYLRLRSGRRATKVKEKVGQKEDK